MTKLKVVQLHGGPWDGAVTRLDAATAVFVKFYELPEAPPADTLIAGAIRKRWAVYERGPDGKFRHAETLTKEPA